MGEGCLGGLIHWEGEGTGIIGKGEERQRGSTGGEAGAWESRRTGAQGHGGTDEEAGAQGLRGTGGRTRYRSLISEE